MGPGEKLLYLKKREYLQPRQEMLYCQPDTAVDALGGL
jgi:hypothetical protein